MTDEAPSVVLHSASFLSGGGRMGELMRTHDWSSTPLREPEQWPQSLRSAVSIMLNSRYPIALYWGEQLALLYNDDWSPIPGSKHPWALGRPGSEVWPEIWDAIGPLFQKVALTGEGIWQQDELLPMYRHGYVEECYYNFTFSPIRGESGAIDGIFNAVVETTDRVLSERRLRVLSRMGERADPALTSEEVCVWITGVLADDHPDVPFALVYLCDGQIARLASCSGVDAGTAAAPHVVSVVEAGAVWPLAAVNETAATTVISPPPGLSLPKGVWPEALAEIVVVPVIAAGDGRPTAFLVAGVNARRRLDAEYQSFFELAAGRIGTALATARAYEEERRRAAALAEIDRAKTAFFANVSHEFRTPLTLLLGPLEEALSGADAGNKPLIEIAYRNGLRLLRLVNNLLDFSRLEAGRTNAAFQPTDLAELTAELASSFRSATDKAGLSLRVDTPALSRLVPVDRDMWEKIVLNLLSNAFKFTFEGEIEVRLREIAGEAMLSVRDTGTGIPALEIPRLFERFHRIDGAKGRSFEGSGIGLALVQELVRLHGGDVTVESAPGQGSTFTVRIPTTRAEDPSETGLQTIPVDTRSKTFVDEAMRWISSDETIDVVPGLDRAIAEIGASTPAGAIRQTVLVADDNADLRQYISRLLSERGYQVSTVADGEAALSAMQRSQPDLLLSDVMMPRMDGFELLRRIREDRALREIPVILLSARAGEEAKVHGLDAGADDYLTKPFAAKELLARVDATLAMSRIRRDAIRQVQESEARYRLAAKATNDAIWDWDLRRDEVVWNEAVTVLFGYGPDVLRTSSDWWIERIHEDDRDRVHDDIAAVISGQGSDWSAEYRFLRADGTYAAILDRGHLVRDDQGKSIRMIGAMLDLTERKRVEAMREAQSRVLELALQDAPLSETLETLVRTVEEASSSRMFGSILLVSEDGGHLRHGAAPSLPGAYNAAIDGIAIGPEVGSCGSAAFRKAPSYVSDIGSDPLWRDFRDLALSHGLRSCWSTPILSGSGQLLGTFAMYYPEPREPSGKDLELVELVTRSASLAIEHKRTETALRELNQSLEQRVHERTRERDRIWNLSRDPFLVADIEGRWLSLSPVWTELLGWSEHELLGRTSEWMEHPDDRNRTRSEVRHIAGGEPTLRFENRFRAKDGSYRWFSWTAVPENELVYAVARDITSEKEAAAELELAQEALRQAQKMEAMGQLTGGVAHDFNNLLTPIVGALDMLQRRGVGGDREQRLISGAAQSAERARVLVQRLLAFARRQPLQATSVDVAALIEGMGELIASTTGPQIKVVAQPNTTSIIAHADANQLEMALLNLSVNARDAMSEGGTLTIGAVATVVGVGHPTKLPAGRYVEVSVADTGTGMDEATLARAVEPFFSTKGVGKGTGLGLSMAHGLASQLGGALTIETHLGSGTKVSIWLTAAEAVTSQDASLPAAPVSPIATGTVLLVDDEDLVRESTADMLSGFGWTVVQASSAEQALRLVEDGLSPDLVVSDHLMPGMSGAELARQLRVEMPHAPVLIISGYAESGGIPQDLARLTKPFRADELSASLASLQN